MFKVNLEKELIRQNKKIHTPEELLDIQEYERIGEDLVSKLEDVFPNAPAKSGEVRVCKHGSFQSQAANFDPSRVFHISQIRSLAIKYWLRVLPTAYFSGSIDKSAIKAITDFELKHHVKLCSVGKLDCDSNNAWIMAPKSSFKLKKKPKDPLLFYRINDEYFYLIHKWGNDLSITRRIISAWHRWIWFVPTALVILCCSIAAIHTRDISYMYGLTFACVTFFLGMELSGLESDLESEFE